MKRWLYLPLIAGLLALGACGAADNPEQDGGMDLTTFWGG